MEKYGMKYEHYMIQQKWEELNRGYDSKAISEYR